MIARLRGVLVERRGDGVIVECGGVGYDVTVPMSTLTALPALGAEVTLKVFTHATENRLALYGFLSSGERELFDLLITVKNVGPSTACAILSGAPSPDGLARTIAAGDVAGLVRLKGVGKKTAELLVVELREKCEHLLATWGANGQIGPMPSRISVSSRAPILDDVASALVNMGWRPAEAEKVLAKMPVPVGATVEVLLREALRAMPR
jgi:holliday junction DNA helicase RuvA